MGNMIITVSRQYGSGGKTIAAMLARNLVSTATVVKFLKWLLRTAESTKGFSVCQTKNSAMPDGLKH